MKIRSERKSSSSGAEGPADRNGLLYSDYFSAAAAASIVICGLLMLFSPVWEEWMSILLLVLGLLMNLAAGWHAINCRRRLEAVFFFAMSALTAAGMAMMFFQR